MKLPLADIQTDESHCKQYYKHNNKHFNFNFDS